MPEASMDSPIGTSQGLIKKTAFSAELPSTSQNFVPQRRKSGLSPRQPLLFLAARARSAKIAAAAQIPMPLCGGKSAR